jgi:CRP/FNR family transcriptional regulator, cyclic AMP receptor protein
MFINKSHLFKQRIVNYKKGEYLFHQNDSTHDLFILKKGSIRIFKQEGNIEIDLDTIGPGNVIGEVASIDGGTRTASGCALDDCEVLFIPSSEFQSILASFPEWFKKIALILVQRLREVDSRISRSIEGDRTNHIAAIISLLAFTDKCIVENGCYTFDKKFLEYYILDLLSIPLGEIADSLDKLETLNYLKHDMTKIVLSSREALDELAEKVFQSRPEAPVI